MVFHPFNHRYYVKSGNSLSKQKVPKMQFYKDFGPIVKIERRKAFKHFQAMT